jgi:D-ribose pyranase
LKPGTPSFIDTVKVIAQELEVERIIMASEIERANSHLKENLLEIFFGSEVELVSHEQFKELTQSAVAVVRTGEITPYANVILVSGVYF